MPSSEELERIVWHDMYGDRPLLKRYPGKVEVWNRAQHATAVAFSDEDGTLHVELPDELLVAAHFTRRAADTEHGAPGPAPLGPYYVRVYLRDDTGRLLLLRRSDDGTEEVVEGHTDDEDAAGDVTAFDSARRELMEEMGYSGPGLQWEKGADRTWVVQLPPGAGPPRLSHEHTAYRWAARAEAARWLESVS